MTKFFRRVTNFLPQLPKPWRIFVVSIIGYAVLLTGVVLLVLPGPGTVVMLIGLGILALEFEWAREASKNGKQWLERIVHKVFRRK